MELPEIIFVQDVANAETLFLIDQTIKEQVDNLPVVEQNELLFNKIYITQFEGAWYVILLYTVLPLLWIVSTQLYCYGLG